MTCGHCSTDSGFYAIDTCDPQQQCCPDDLADAELQVCREEYYFFDVPRSFSNAPTTTQPVSNAPTSPPPVVAQPVVLSCPSPDEMRNWPRYTVAQRRNGDIYLAIFRPNQSNYSQRLREISDADIQRYWREVNQVSQIDAANPTTWGPVIQLNLPLCYLNRLADGRRELNFDGNRLDTCWTFDIYNLDPIWRNFIIRTLMIFPIEFMRLNPIRSIYLDFKVGERPGLRGVTTGGANWPRCGQSIIPQDRRNGICVAFAALNRPWCQSSQNIVSINPSCQQIEDSFADTNKVASTIYHEYGHIFLNCAPQRSDFPTGPSGDAEYRLERNYHQELNNNHRNDTHNESHTDRDQGLWDRFRLAINYSGKSQRQGEGFAEAFRMRMMGVSLGTGGTREARQHAEEVLDLAGIPTRSSVISARQAINQYLSTHQL